MIQNQYPERKLLSREEAADYLGISESTLANWACTKKVSLRYVKIGRSVKYLQSDLDTFIQNRRVD